MMPPSARRWVCPPELRARPDEPYDQAAAWELALGLARHAAAHDEVPVGAVVLGTDDLLLGTGCDLKTAWADPTAHAEVIALRDAAACLGDWRLDGCRLLVTLEPCAMCAGAILLARVARLDYAAASPKFGAIASRARVLEAGPWNHRVAVGRAPDTIVEASAALLRAYFRAKRKSVD